MALSLATQLRSLLRLPVGKSQQAVRDQREQPLSRAGAAGGDRRALDSVVGLKLPLEPRGCYDGKVSHTGHVIMSGYRDCKVESTGYAIVSGSRDSGVRLLSMPC
jgi:hypothetical protein